MRSTASCLAVLAVLPCQHAGFLVQLVFVIFEIKMFFVCASCELQTNARGRDPRDSSDGKAGGHGGEGNVCLSAPSFQVRDLNVYFFVVSAS